MAYAIIRGSTATFALIDDTGSFSNLYSIRVVMKAALESNTPPGDTAPDLAVATTTWVPATLTEKAYWHIEFSATTTESLQPGNYVMDARLQLGTKVIQTSPVSIVIEERVTEAS